MVQKRVRGHLRKVPGQKAQVRVRGHLRKIRTDIKKKGKGSREDGIHKGVCEREKKARQ